MVGLEKITNKIIADASEQAQKTLLEAKEKCDRIDAECEKRMADIREKIYSDALAEGESIKVRSMSDVSMTRREMLLSVRNRLADEVFETAVQNILDLDEEKYCELMTSLLCRALCTQVESEKESMRLYGEDTSPQSYEVIMNKNDRDKHGQYIVAGVRRATVGKITGDVLDKITLSDKVAPIEGGIILKCGDIEINCAFSAMVEEMRKSLEAEVMATLFPLGEESGEYVDDSDDAESLDYEDEAADEEPEYEDAVQISDEEIADCESYDNNELIAEDEQIVNGEQTDSEENGEENSDEAL